MVSIIKLIFNFTYSGYWAYDGIETYNKTDDAITSFVYHLTSFACLVQIKEIDVRIITLYFNYLSI